MYKVYFKGTKHMVYFETIREARLHADLTGWSYTMFYKGREIEKYEAGQTKALSQH